MRSNSHSTKLLGGSLVTNKSGGAVTHFHIWARWPTHGRFPLLISMGFTHSPALGCLPSRLERGFCDLRNLASSETYLNVFIFLNFVVLTDWSKAGSYSMSTSTNSIPSYYASRALPLHMEGWARDIWENKGSC